MSSHFTKLKYTMRVNCIIASVQDGIIQGSLLPLKACAYLENHVMLLVYGYIVRRHDIRSAIKAAETLETVYQCSSSEDLMMALSCLRMNGHDHRFTCTLVDIHAHRRPNSNMSPGTSKQALTNDKHFQCSNRDEFD